MNILFLTLIDVRSAQQRGIYTDLLRRFAARGHEVYIVSPAERRQGLNTQMLPPEDGVLSQHVHILKVKTGNIQKTNILEKGISTVLLEYQVSRAIRKYLKDTRFDLVLYSTPPITLEKPISFVHRRDKAATYLLLKDIFPQNAVDLGMMKKTGLKGLLYRFFRNKEKRLYRLSDRIGCMSQANVEYLLRHNPEIDPARVEVCPNSIEPVDMTVDDATRAQLREKYGLPLDKKIFVYGGNLGKPQGIPFLLRALEACRDKDVYFLIVGSGTEFGKLETWCNSRPEGNVKLLRHLPKEDYDRLVAACDVGLIFLDHRFTIPNFPSRLLSYMQAGLPVLCATEPNTDIGQVVTEGGFGWWCQSNDEGAFAALVDESLTADLAAMAKKELEYLHSHYTVERGYEIITREGESK